ncbi:MAG: hypothetical protein ACO3QV_01190 [Candidatus Nanopelagicaceae bacterium]
MSMGSSAEFDKYAWPPFIDKGLPADSVTSYQWLTSDTFAGDTTSGEGVSFISTAPDVQPICENFDDPFCLNQLATGDRSWWINVVLNECQLYGSVYPCIEGVRITKDEKSRSLVFSRYVDSISWDPDPSRNIPPGGLASLWKDPTSADGIEYLVIVSGPLYWPNQKAPIAGKPSLLSTFQASIIATKSIKGDFSGPRRFISDEGVPRYSSEKPLYCLWVIKGECGFKVDFPEQSRFELSLNLPRASSGFLIGRMKDPEVRVTVISPDQVNLKVSAEPILIPLLHAKVKAADATPEIRRYFANPRKYLCPTTDPNCLKGVIASGTASSGETAFEYYSLLGAFLEKSAAKMVPIWSFRNHIADLRRCNSPQYFEGLVSTNAAIYEGDPPSLVDGELVYRVAGVHNDSDGKVFQGSYDLILQSSVARCLYKLNNNPIQASISIENQGGDVNVKTTIFKEEGGWVRLSAAGFTFSQPTIKVKLTQQPNVSPSISPTPKPSPTFSSSKEVKSTITCVKGSKTKKVSGVKPKCPKGFRKR